MGAADVIPGVSGGTVAFITGIYEELIHSLAAIDLEAGRLLRKLEFALFWKKINGNFLAVVLAGIVTSTFSLAKLMMYMLQHHPLSVRSFFFGLILISIVIVLREIKKWNLPVFILFIMGVLIAYGITMLSPAQLPEHWFLVFLAGILVSCSLILPGISWVLILSILGLYKYIVGALVMPNILVILVFMTGCLFGIIGFSRFLSRILEKYHNPTVALLAGFMLGSLNKLWPWREVLEFVTNTKGEQIPVFDKSVLPWHYMTTTSRDPQVFQAIFMMALGVFIVVLMEKISTRLKTKI